MRFLRKKNRNAINIDPGPYQFYSVTCCAWDNLCPTSTPHHPEYTSYEDPGITAEPSIYGFVFKSQEAMLGKAYRASVWASSAARRTYYKIGSNGTEVCPVPVIFHPVFVDQVKWCRMDLIIPGSAVTSSAFEIGAKSNNGRIVFDGFRFQPVEAAMTGCVYNRLDFEYASNLCQKAKIITTGFFCNQ